MMMITDTPYRDTMVVGRLSISHEFATDQDLPNLEDGTIAATGWLRKIVVVLDWDETGSTVLAYANEAKDWVPLSLLGGF